MLLKKRSNKSATTTKKYLAPTCKKPSFNIVVDIVLKKITIETTTPTSRSSNFIFIIKLPDKEFLKKRFGGNNAQQVSSTVLNFPLFPYMTEAEYKEILSIIENFLSGKN